MGIHKGTDLFWLKEYQFKKGQPSKNKGIKRTPEERLAMSLAIKKGFSNGRVVWNKGKKRPPFSQEWKDKMRKSAHKKHSPEHNLAVSVAKKGKRNLLIAGKRNHFWKGDSALWRKRRMLRNSPACRLWRRIILERDNYTCQICNRRGGKLEVDHIVPIVIDPDKMFLLSNGRVLCSSCHRKTPTYGYKLSRKGFCLDFDKLEKLISIASSQEVVLNQI